MLTLQNKLITLLVLLIGSSSGFKLDPTKTIEERDIKFTEFLNKTMAEYGQWLKEEKLDPSPPLPGVLSMATETSLCFLNCDIKNQVVQNHSKDVEDVPTTEGRLSDDYYARLGRIVNHPYEFVGEYNCNGVLFSGSNAGLVKDLPFSGQGKFVFNVKSSTEMVEVMNLGINEDHTLNLTHSWSDYFFHPAVGQAQLDGVWNTTDVANHLKAIQAGFREIYYNHIRGESQDLVHANPSRMVFQIYTRQVLGKVNLLEFLDDEDLPPPHSATPTPPPSTPRPTTPPTSRSTTTPTTSGPTTPKTTPRIKFTQFLNKTMDEYGQWLKDEKLDPSPPLPAVVPISWKSTAYLLDCDIKNQVVQNHSKTVGDVPATEGSLDLHYAVLGREVNQQYEFTGEYNCRGVLYAAFIVGLDRDLPFSGQGNFVVKVNSSIELAEVMNLGIKEDNTFDMTHSWTGYLFHPEIDSAQLNGVWNNTDVANHLNTIQRGFASSYYEHITRESHNLLHTNPSRMVLQNYTRHVLGKVNLAEFLDEEDLPPPYSATPTVPTTPKTTETPTSGTSDPTTSSTTPATSTDKEKESGAVSIFMNFGTASWTILFVLLPSLMTRTM